MLTSFTCLLWLLPLSSAGLVEHWFEIGWTSGAPDGFNRSVMAVNGTWPPPIIFATIGDRIVVHATNKMQDQGTSLHFHGLFQNGTNAMDGPVGVTQCGIPPGHSMTYNFTVEQPGLYWWHSHSSGQYPDGLRAPLLISDPDEPFIDDWAEEMVLSISDWYHDPMEALIPTFLNLANPSGVEPVPNSALLNDTQNLTIPVEANKVYKINMVNVGAFAGQYVWIPGIKLTVIEVDGVYTQKVNASSIYLASAQRYVFLATFPAGRNYPIVTSMDETMFDIVPDGLNPNATGWFVTDPSLPNPAPPLTDFADVMNDMSLQAFDGMELLSNPDTAFSLDVLMNNLGNGINYAFFSGNTYVAPKVPTLMSVLSTGANATQAEIYGSNAGVHFMEPGQVVEVVLNNNDPGRHPFHLHGRNFQVVARSGAQDQYHRGGWVPGSKVPNAPAIPMRRDTIVLEPYGYAVLRYVADNPGVWFFHCHVEWHMLQGLEATFIESPFEIQAKQHVPADSYANCRAQGLPIKGNAVGNTGARIMDLTGEDLPPPSLPAGFTAKGIVAMVFCVLSAFLGCGSLVLYGLAEVELPSS